MQTASQVTNDPAFGENQLTPEEKKMVDDFSKKIDLHNSQAILEYGVGTQKKMADFSEGALKNVRTKDMDEVGDMLSGLVSELKSFEITEEDIDNDIKRVQERNSRLVTVEGRAAENGDVAVIDFEGFLDGEAFDGGKAENYSLTLGEGQFIPGFEEQIVDHNAGEEFTINVTFPEDYQAEELAGKATEFKINLHEIKKRELPEVDDEFIKDVSEFETVADYRADVKEKLAKAREEEAKNDKNNQVAKSLAEKLVAEIPDAMYENAIDNFIGEFEMNLRAQGLDINTYMQYVGLDEQALREQYKERAEAQVKVRLALRAVAEAEGIDASEEEIEEEYNKLAEAYKVDVARVKAAFTAEDIAKDVKNEKAMKLVQESAVEAAGEEA